jgi:hypothetical protein
MFSMTRTVWLVALRFAFGAAVATAFSFPTTTLRIFTQNYANNGAVRSNALGPTRFPLGMMSAKDDDNEGADSITRNELTSTADGVSTTTTSVRSRLAERIRQFDDDATTSSADVDDTTANFQSKQGIYQIKSKEQHA